jgi:hypothetical protein
LANCGSSASRSRKGVSLAICGECGGEDQPTAPRGRKASSA